MAYYKELFDEDIRKMLRRVCEENRLKFNKRNTNEKDSFVSDSTFLSTLSFAKNGK